MPKQNRTERLKNQNTDIVQNRRLFEENQQRYRQRSNSKRTLRSIQENTDQLKLNRNELELREMGLENWETRNPGVQNLSAAAISGFVLYLLLLPAVYVIDVTVFGEVVREVGKVLTKAFRWFSQETVIVFVALVLPAAYLILEVALGNHLENKQENDNQANQENDDQDNQIGNTRNNLIKVFAIIVWLTLPALVFVFSFANSGLVATTVGSATFWAKLGKVVGLTLFALVAHGAVLWFGGRIWNAVSYLLIYKPYEIWLNRRITRLGQDITQNKSQIEEQFRNYYQNFQASNQNGDNTGLFSKGMREAVNEVFDKEIITNTPSNEDDTSVTSNKNEDSENTIEQNLQNEDSVNTDEIANSENSGFNRDDEDEVQP